MSTQLHAMTHGIQGLELGYTLMLVAILAGLVHARASWGKFLLSAVVALPVTLLAGLVISLTSPLLGIFGIGKESALEVAFGVVAMAAMGYIAGRALAAHNRTSSSAEHRRGAIVTMARHVFTPRRGRVSLRSWGSTADASSITLADIPVSLEDETKHFKLIGTTGNTLILRCSASERGGTSEFASKLIGQREVLHTTLSKSRRSGDWRSSTTTSQHLRIEPAVMASEIERLPDLAGFLKLATTPDWQCVRLTPRNEPVAIRVRKPSVAASPPGEFKQQPL